MKSKLILLTVLTLVSVPISVQAATLLIGDKISIEEGEVIENDYYVSVGSLGTTIMSGEVKGDMYALAGSVTANGIIHGDFGSIGGLAFMHASVTDDVRIVAGEAVIDDYVGGDVFVVAGILKILSTAQIQGDVIFFGAEGEINGKVGGSVYGTSNRLRIDAEVGNNVDVKVTGELTLGSKANIAGNVRHAGLNNLVRAQEAVVEGDIQHVETVSTATEDPLRNFLVPLFVSLFATLTLYLLFKREIELVIKTMMRSPLAAGALGLAVLAAGPVISVILILTVLGMLLGVFGVGAMLVLGAVGFALAIIFLGTLLSKVLVNKVQVSLPWILFGALAFHLLLQLPVFGVAAVFVLMAITIGGVVLTIFRALR